MKALIYAVHTANQPIADNGVIVFDTIVRKVGNAIQLAGGNVMTTEAGFYRGNVNLTVQTAAAEAITAQVLVNGTPIPGAEATLTSSAADEIGSMAIPFVIRTYGCCMAAPSVITVQLDNAATVTNAAIEVVR